MNRRIGQGADQAAPKKAQIKEGWQPAKPSGRFAQVAPPMSFRQPQFSAEKENSRPQDAEKGYVRRSPEDGKR